jgi:hypothetical protein
MWVSPRAETSVDMGQEKMRLPERRRIVTEGAAGFATRHAVTSTK